MDFLPSLDHAFWIVAGLALIAGAVRGFVGFGAGMIMIPFVSALYGPKIGATSILVADGILTIPYILKSIRICEPRTVAPVAFGAVLMIPVGAYLLTTVDPTPIRWAMVPIIAGLLAITLSGWRYHGIPKVGVSLTTGATSGFLSGLIQLSGPPVVVLWMSGPFPPQTIRANIFVYFAVTSLVAVVSYALAGVFTRDLIPVLVPMIPCYAVGLAIGGRFFGKADPKLFRRVAVVLIALAVVVSLPVLDPYLR
ncbi:sulfite exporter TauE/SafE family protein [Dongia sp. agr-C8]